MKLNSYRALLLTGIAALLSTVPAAHAQNSGILTVPFSFQAGPSYLPAGTYTISTTSGHVATLRSGKTTSLAMAMTFPNDKAIEKGRAQFVRAGDRYYLKDVWVPNSENHLHFINPKPKQQVKLASNDTRPANVEVAFLEPLR